MVAKSKQAQMWCIVGQRKHAACVRICVCCCRSGFYHSLGESLFIKSITAPTPPGSQKAHRPAPLNPMWRRNVQCIRSYLRMWAMWHIKHTNTYLHSQSPVMFRFEKPIPIAGEEFMTGGKIFMEMDDYGWTKHVSSPQLLLLHTYVRRRRSAAGEGILDPP